MFASLKDGGHLQVFELIEHPEITVTRRQETRKHNWVQTISIGLQTFETLDAAIKWLSQNAMPETKPSRFERKGDL